MQKTVNKQINAKILTTLCKIAQEDADERFS